MIISNVPLEQLHSNDNEDYEYNNFYNNYLICIRIS